MKLLVNSQELMEPLQIKIRKKGIVIGQELMQTSLTE